MSNSNRGNQTKALPSNLQPHHRRDGSPTGEAHHHQSREADLQNTFWTEEDHFLGTWDMLWVQRRVVWDFTGPTVGRSG